MAKDKTNKIKEQIYFDPFIYALILLSGYKSNFMGKGKVAIGPMVNALLGKLFKVKNYNPREKKKLMETASKVEQKYNPKWTMQDRSQKLKEVIHKPNEKQTRKEKEAIRKFRKGCPIEGKAGQIWFDED